MGNSLKSIRLVNVSGVRWGRPVLLIGVTDSDEFREASSGPWRLANEENWRHGRQVEAVTHYNQLAFARGDWVEIKSGSGHTVAYVELTNITMVEPERFSSAQFRETQYRSRSAYTSHWGYHNGVRAWAYRLRYLTGDDVMPPLPS